MAATMFRVQYDKCPDTEVIGSIIHIIPFSKVVHIYTDFLELIGPCGLWF